jgi:uncharacterized integral membrane protein
VAAVTIVIVTFVLQNTHAVSLRFLDWRFEALPLAAAILASSLVTGSAVTAAALVHRRALLARLRRLEDHLRTRGPSDRRADRSTGVRATAVQRSAQLRSVGAAPWPDAPSDPA